MRSIEEIKADINAAPERVANGKAGNLLNLTNELREAKVYWRDRRLQAIDGIPTDRLEAICTAESEGRCVVISCRCGDCRYRKCTKEAYKVWGYICTNSLSPCRGRIVQPTFFCEWGEREEAEAALSQKEETPNKEISPNYSDQLGNVFSVVSGAGGAGFPGYGIGLGAKDKP